MNEIPIIEILTVDNGLDQRCMCLSEIILIDKMHRNVLQVVG